MTTHASRSMEALERLERERDALNERIEQVKTEAEVELLMADVLALLRDLNTRNWSEGQRTRAQGVKKRILQRIGRAA